MDNGLIFPYWRGERLQWLLGRSASEWIEVASGENPRGRAVKQEVTGTKGREKLRLAMSFVIRTANRHR